MLILRQNLGLVVHCGGLSQTAWDLQRHQVEKIALVMFQLVLYHLSGSHSGPGSLAVPKKLARLADYLALDAVPSLDIPGL